MSRSSCRSDEEATALVKDCPILAFGGNVEIRRVADRDFNQENGKEFLLVFRGDYNAIPKESPEGMQAATQKWMNWIAVLQHKIN